MIGTSGGPEMLGFAMTVAGWYNRGWGRGVPWGPRLVACYYLFWDGTATLGGV